MHSPVGVCRMYVRREVTPSACRDFGCPIGVENNLEGGCAIGYIADADQEVGAWLLTDETIICGRRLTSPNLKQGLFHIVCRPRMTQ
jgi:hypothetical protein